MTAISPPACCAGDRTRAAVLRWTTALPAERYLIAAIPAGADCPTHRRLLTREEFDLALGWLRWLNTTGHHIVGRPWDARHVLVDDLGPATLETVARQHRPAAIVESSPGSFQVWLTLAEHAVPPALAGAAARLLAERFGGDRGAASPCQPGRICGFTNRKPHHRLASGLFPFALLREADGPLVDPAGAEVLAEAARLKPAAHRLGEVGDAPAIPDRPRRGLVRCSPGEEHACATRWIARRLPPGVALDRSRADHAVARRLLARGMPPAEVTEVVLAGERAKRMPAAAAEVYAQRTVEAAKASLNPGYSASRED
jgi:hypothetical protein